MTRREKIKILLNTLATIEDLNESISCACAEGPEFMSKLQITEFVIDKSVETHRVIKSAYAKIGINK